MPFKRTSEDARILAIAKYAKNVFKFIFFSFKRYVIIKKQAKENNNVMVPNLERVKIETTKQAIIDINENTFAINFRLKNKTNEKGAIKARI